MNMCTNQTVLEVEEGDTEESQQIYKDISIVVNKILIPGVCVFGMVGNILNLTVLTRRMLQKSFRTLEQAANLCLISLAVSDLMFCVFVFPHMFLPADDTFHNQGLLFQYKMYCAAVINIFIMESTLLTVAMSLERYLACCFPLRQDLYLTTRRIKFVIVFTFIFSVAFNVPVFWRFKAVTLCATNSSFPSLANATNLNGNTNVGTKLVHSTARSILEPTLQGYRDPKSALSSFLPNASQSATVRLITNSSPSPSAALPSGLNSTAAAQDLFNVTPVRYSTKMVNLMDSELVDTVYRILWSVIGNVIPLILLFYFNVCLCRQIYNSYKMRRQFKRPSKAKSSSHTLTITLVVIVVMFFILVAPSEIVLFVLPLTKRKRDSQTMIVETTLNLMQAINFSVNFILYCIISPYFRKTLKYLLLCGCYNIYQVSRQWKKEFQTSLM